VTKEQGTATPGISGLEDLKSWLRAALRDYRWRVRGIVLDDNTILPLPQEPALIAKVIEVSVIEHLKRKAIAVRGLDVLGDLSGRGYPDVLLTGQALTGKKVAVDVKVARRKPRRSGRPTVTQSRITLGPFDSYFRRPDQPIPGVGVAYGDFAWHVDVIVLYDYLDGDVKEIEILVVETWRVASMKRSSTTRNYIGAVTNLDELRNEQSQFATEEEFLAFWRRQPVRAVPEPRTVDETPESIEAEDLPERT
jgi:hypothetical protein